jgi:hypothetical protein
MARNEYGFGKHDSVIGKVKPGSVRVAAVTSMGNARKSFVLDAADGNPYRLETAGNSSLGFTIDNGEYREEDHVFTFNGWGKVAKAGKVHS